jgi:hypothetical protein
MSLAADPYALNDDGTAKDPAAFKAALQADPVKMESLEQEPEVAKLVLGDDLNAFQELIKSVYQVRNARRRVQPQARLMT